MTTPILSTVAQLTDSELVAHMKHLAAREHATGAEIIAHLAEIDSRQLHSRDGYSSLFDYCVERFRFSEAQAFSRIQVARAARDFPFILELLADGSVNLTTVRLLAPHLKDDDFRAVPEAAKGRRKREIEKMVAALAPKPDVPDSVRKLPAPSPDRAAVALSAPALPSLPQGEAAVAGSPPPVAAPSPLPAPSPSRPAVTPLAPERYKLQFTIGGETLERLKLARDMLRHALPSADLGEIFDRALVALLEDLAKKKFANTDEPRPSKGTAPGSRHIPAAVRREVWLRDGGRCTFVGVTGRRCTTRTLLEFHHVVPFAAGGKATAANLTLLCRAHNAHEADLFFGPHAPDDHGGFVREAAATYGLRSYSETMTARFAATGSGTSRSRAAPPVAGAAEEG